MVFAGMAPVGELRLTSTFGVSGERWANRTYPTPAADAGVLSRTDSPIATTATAASDVSLRRRRGAVTAASHPGRSAAPSATDAMGTLLHTERNRYGPFGWDRKPETHVWAIDTTEVPVRRADGAGEGT